MKYRYIKKMLNDKKFRVPRVWSNFQLKKFAPLFKGDIINVSGWKDEDKEGNFYKNYFQNADSYHISNYKSEACGFQGNIKNEFFLDLEKQVENKYKNKFDVVFNHTVLEHVFDVNQAFKNLCDMSKDIVIVIVPFLQEEHTDYGDYWRFTPQAIKKLFRKNGLDTIYLNYNDNSSSSIYIFAIGSKNPKNWKNILNMKENKRNSNKLIGTNIIKRNKFVSLLGKIKNFFKKDDY